MWSNTHCIYSISIIIYITFSENHNRSNKLNAAFNIYILFQKCSFCILTKSTSHKIDHQYHLQTFIALLFWVTRMYPHHQKQTEKTVHQWTSNINDLNRFLQRIYPNPILQNCFLMHKHHICMTIHSWCSTDIQAVLWQVCRNQMLAINKDAGTRQLCNIVSLSHRPLSAQYHFCYNRG